MSLTNAISAISVIAAIELAGGASERHTTLSIVLGTTAVAAASTNVIGGFMITDRMLKMFKKRKT
jgi:NAD(P) transhydrogenase subunit alpha